MFQITLAKHVKHFTKKISFIQERMLLKRLTMQHKIEIIKSIWDKMMIDLIKQYTSSKDEGMQRIVMEISKIKTDVRDFVIASFMR